MPSPLALTPRTIRLLIIGILILGGLSAYRLFYAPPPGSSTTFSGRTMGTTWSVHLANKTLGPAGMRQATAAVQAALDEVVASMSSWDSDSELSRFNASSSTEPQVISASILTVLEAAQTVSEKTNGAFDVTVSPLVEAWGFGAAEIPDQPPSQTEIERLLNQTDYRQLILDPTQGTLAKQQAGMEIDLSAIAKGYGVDRAVEALEELGYANYLVEVGGELRARGRRLDGKLWRVAIESPSDGVRGIHRILNLEDIAMATSGDYRNFYESEGRRVSHTLDPRTGRPIEHGLASVSVLHPSATGADAWATALNVLGPDSGYARAEEKGLAAYFIVREPTGDPFSVRMTPAFARYLDRVESQSDTPNVAPGE